MAPDTSEMDTGMFVDETRLLGFIYAHFIVFITLTNSLLLLWYIKHNKLPADRQRSSLVLARAGSDIFVALTSTAWICLLYYFGAKRHSSIQCGLVVLVNVIHWCFVCPFVNSYILISRCWQLHVWGKFTPKITHLLCSTAIVWFLGFITIAPSWYGHNAKDPNFDFRQFANTDLVDQIKPLILICVILMPLVALTVAIIMNLKRYGHHPHSKRQFRDSKSPMASSISAPPHSPTTVPDVLCHQTSLDMSKERQVVLEMSKERQMVLLVTIINVLLTAPPALLTLNYLNTNDVTALMAVLLWTMYLRSVVTPLFWLFSDKELNEVPRL